MTTDKIELPTYKTPPPVGGSPWQWWLFFLQPHGKILSLCFLVNVLRQGFFRGMPIFLGIFVGLVESGQAAENPWILIQWIAIYAGLAICVFTSLLIIYPTGRRIDQTSKHIALYGFRHYLNLSERWHENKASGEKLQRLLASRQGAFDLLENFFWHMAPIPGIMLAVCTAVIMLDAPLYYVLLFAGMITAYLTVAKYTSDWLFRVYKDINKTLEAVVSGVYEFVVSTATVRFFNLAPRALETGQKLEFQNHKARMDFFDIVFKRWFSINITTITCIVIIIGTASYDVLHGRMPVSAYTTIIFMTLDVWLNIETVAIIYARMIEQWEGFKRLVEVLNIQPKITETDNARDLDTREPSISFDHINFHYHEEKAVVQDFSLEIAPGEKIGLIGPSGAGKSTIVKLLLRFYDVESGVIKIGDQDIRRCTLSSLQDSIAVIPQDVVLFNHELRENIRYGQLDASDEQVYEAARKAHAHDFIRELPDGYETLVGERGVKLSGGQRQRIAIARAILKDAPILILDEATSALDSESEKFIQESLKDLMEGKTVIAIAHRLSTIAHLDRLVVMKEGRIVEQGSHNDLLATGGLYAKLWNMQSGGFLGE